MRDILATVRMITKTNRRKSLFHFTRARNVAAIAHLNAIYSSGQMNSGVAGERRVKAQQVNVEGYAITINAHLRIPDSMMGPGVTQEQFRSCLDRHVFFWPTLQDCQKMMDSYARREPDERFAVLEFDAYALISEHNFAVKLSKYDSGSSPRFPAHCSYKKSPSMLLPLHRFQSVTSSLVPAKPSEIREVLVEGQVSNISKYLQAVYVEDAEDVPAIWKSLVRPMSDLRDRRDMRDLRGK